MAEQATRVEVAARAGRSSEGPSRRCPTCSGQYPLDFLVCPKDACLLELSGTGEDPLLGELVGGSFLITRLLGEGGMGRVYEAEHARLPRRFAVKVMLDQLASQPDAVARFEREAQAVASVVSEHVLDVVDVVRVQGRPCMVTELLRGEELGDVLERTGKLPIAQVIEIGRQVCRGLAAAHAAQVVHRDLKPSNLFLVDRGPGATHVKILDFGIAKVDGGGDQLTRTGMVLGTPAYMAPEQARGSANVDARSDLYSLGAVLYRMITGRPPFPPDDPAVTLGRLLTESPPRLREIDPNVPLDVETVVMRAMARDPAERPASAGELERMLAALDTRLVGVAAPLAVALPPPAVIAAAEAATVELRAPSGEIRPPRAARFTALILTITSSLAGGVAVLVAVAAILRVATGRSTPTGTELVLISLLALVSALLLALGALRVLVQRWSSPPAMERLGSGLRAAVIWNLVPLGALTLGTRAHALFDPVLSRELGDALEIGVMIAPLLLGLFAFVAALWRARRA